MVYESIVWYMRNEVEGRAKLSRGTKKDDFSSQFFRIFEIIIFCLVVAL